MKILYILLLYLLLVTHIARADHHTGFCGTSSTSLLLSRSANSPEGKRSPYIQMLYSARVGFCMRVASGEITPPMARRSLAGLENILSAVKATPLDPAMIQRVLSHIDSAKEKP